MFGIDRWKVRRRGLLQSLMLWALFILLPFNVVIAHNHAGQWTLAVYHGRHSWLRQQFTLLGLAAAMASAIRITQKTTEQSESWETAGDVWPPAPRR